MYKTVTVDVEVSLDDFETDDLVAELESRNVSFGGATEDAVSTLSELHYALKFGLNDKALEVARRYVNDQLGTAL